MQANDVLSKKTLSVNCFICHNVTILAIADNNFRNMLQTFYMFFSILGSRTGVFIGKVDAGQPQKQYYCQNFPAGRVLTFTASL